MKKLKLLMFCCLLSIASFGGNPKYMHVSVIYQSTGTTLFVIDETGKIEEQKLKPLVKGLSYSLNNAIESQAEIQNRLNALGAKGWKVTEVSNLGESGLVMINYLLSKEE